MRWRKLNCRECRNHVAPGENSQSRGHGLGRAQPLRRTRDFFQDSFRASRKSPLGMNRLRVRVE